MKVLLIEDHRDIAGIIFDFFELKGYTLDYANNGQQGIELCLRNHYDVIILDVMMPLMDGLTMCKTLREKGDDTPVLMLTARDHKNDILDGFSNGADDYLVKPFDLNILDARVNALYRRKTGSIATQSLVFADLELDLQSHTARRDSKTLPLNQTQFKILKTLMMRAPNLTSREELIKEVWGDEQPDGDVLRSHIYQLRCLIDKPFKEHYLKTIPKVGYQLHSEIKT